MTFGVIKALLAVFVFAQFSGSEASNILLIARYNRKFNALEAELTQSVADGTRDLAKSREYIDANANEAQHTVDNVINNFRQTIANEQREAEHRRRNIRHCVSEANRRLGELNKNAIDQCRQWEEDNDLQGNIDDISNLIEEVKSRRNRCILRNPIALLLKRCFDNEIADAENKRQELTQKINSGLHNANEQSVLCISNAQQSVKAVVQRIEADFGRCVRRSR